MVRFALCMLLAAGCASSRAFVREPMPENPEPGIREWFARNLKDPGSLQIRDMSSPMPARCYAVGVGWSDPLDGWLVTAIYNARNGFGGMGELEAVRFLFRGERLVQIDGPCYEPSGRQIPSS